MEVMTAYRFRRAPSPPDRRPPRRGGGSSPYAYAASAAVRPAGPARLSGGRRGLLRSARALTALALLAILGALLLPITAQAQTATVLVSNIGQTSDAVAGVDNGELVGQVFTVASGGGNYTLTSIEVPVDLLNTTALTAEDIKLLSASLWSADEFALPVSSLQTLDNPSSISDGDTATFTDPSGTTLEAGKRYAVVFVYNKSAVEFQIKAVGSGSEDGASLAGWNISNVRRIRAATATTWTQDSNSLLIRVNGSAASGDPPPLSTDATLSGLSLGTGVTLSPAFASGTDTYTASVANSVDKVTVTATENHASADSEIQDADGNALDDADDNAADFQVALSVGDTVIKVKVTAEAVTSTQTYTVTVTRAADMTPDDPPDDSGNVSEGDTDLPGDTTTTGKVEVGGSVTGTIADTIDDLSSGDSFKVDLEAGKRYQIDVEGAPTGRGTLPDPWLASIVDPDGNQVQSAGDNDSGVGLNARLILTPTEDGAHDVNVRAYFVPSAQPGTYTLSVIVLGANGASEADTDFPATTATSGRVEVGASATGNIENLDDAYDWFRVDLEAGKTYQFDLEGVDTSRGMLDDPYLGLFDGSGTSLFDDDDDGTGLNSRITHTPATGGTYYLGAARAGTSAGTYTLSVREIPSVTLSIADAEGAEDEGVEFTVTLSAVAATDVTATWTASIETGDTASTADLATTKTGTVTVDDGETTAKFTVPVNDDNTDEPDQTFTVTLSGVSSNAQLAADATATGTITDDDNLPLLAIGGGGASEASTQALSVSLTPASGREVMVTWTATIESHDTAEAADFTDLSTATGTVTIPAGQISILLFVRGVIDDSLDEDDESFTVTLSSPVNATLSTTHTVGRVTIQDDDDPPTVTVADAAATEGDKVEFVVTLSAVSGRDVTVDYATSVATGDDATSGTDFTAASGTLTIEEGDETGTIEVQTTEDSTEEEDETFTLTISDPANATLGTKTAARGTIKDDDGTLTPTNCTLNTGDVWCGEVTVGAETNTGGATTGHGFSSITGDSFGTLTDNSGDQTFTYGTQTYLVNRVVAGAGTFAGELNFRVRRAVPEGFLLDDDHVAKLALHVAGSSNPFAFKVATSSTSVGYIWRNSGLDWSSATPVTVRLRELPDAPTGFEAAVGNAQVGLTWDAPASGANITRHEFRQKTGGGSYPTTWTAIATSAPGGTNEASFTVTGLTNEIAHTFELRAVNDSGGGAADESDEVTPTPGICGRTAKIQEVILVELADVTDCAAVTVADLASITTFGVNGFGTFDQGITSLQAGDFAGLTALTALRLGDNQLASLPAGIFSGLAEIEDILLNGNELTALPEGTFANLSNLTEIDLSANDITQIPAGLFTGLTSLDFVHLSANELTEIPAGLFTGLTSLTELELGENELSSLDAGVFSGLTALEYLGLGKNELSSLPAGLFTGMAVLEELNLQVNDLTGLPAGLFSDLTALQRLRLNDNDLSSLPDGLLSGLTGLTRLQLFRNTVDPLPLTVTVEKVGTDQARAEVLAGAPLAVAFKATVANGSLAGGATTLGVAAGSVEGTPVTVTRTSGTTESVTVDIDLSTQPSLPTNHQGYEFVKATSGLPATILPAVGMTPTIDDVDITSSPVLETDTYGAGETIRLTVEFSEAVTVTGQPHIEFSLGNMNDTRDVDAAYESGSGADELVFAYTVVSSDEDNNGIFTHPDALMVESGESIVSAGGVNADLDHAGDGTDSGHKVDGSRSIVSVAVSSTPMLETDTYGAGEKIRFTVTFSAAVDVTGDPVLAFALGNQDDVRDVDAAHESGSGTTALVFGYTVASTDDDNNGIYLKDEQDFNNPDGPVRLDSDDTIRFAGTSTDVPLYWQGRGTQSGHKVDGSRTTGNNAPSFTSSATFDAAENQTSAGTVEAEDSDTEDNIEGYEIAGGADSDFFSEVTSAGVLTFDEAPNFEDPQDQGADNTYVVTVEATSGTGAREMTATQTITVTVTDADEKSAKPDKPTLAAVAGSSTSLTATWTAPGLNDGPAITGYDVGYKVSTANSWTSFTHTGTGVTATITGLTASTSYQVRVLAKNGETDSDWSDASDAVKTNAETPDAPTITAVAVTSTPQLETDTYGEDETIEVSVTFSEAVNATSDTDFVLSVSGDKRAPLVRGSGTTTLAFGYTVASSDDDDNGIWIGDQDRTLAGDRRGNPQNGAIASAATSAAADLAHASLGTLSGHKVDGSRTPTPDDDPLNNDPVFTEGDSATREVANGSSPATKIGQPVTATDADNDELVYDLEGDDRSLFIITENSAQILTWPVPGVVDYSGRNSYQVTVKARDGKGGSDAIDVTINFTDSDDGPPEGDDEDDGPPEDDEDDGPPEENDDGPPETPTTPVAPPVPHTTTPARLRIRALDADADSMSLHMSWRAPEANAAAVTGYRFRVFEGPATRRVWPPVVDWTPVPEPLYEQNGRYEHTVRLSVASAYTVWLRAALTNGFSDHAQADIFYFHPVGAESEERPERVALIGNYPNPFNPSTEIVYELPGPGPVRLVVYDMIGREVQVLADAHRPAGRHTARFDAEGLPTGTYAYTLTAGSVAITRVMVLVR